uniref:ABC transporter ATP-binding protein/permease n=1 Tax=Vaginimicrobium propionicum TaxID=1871034 RepID=UPI0009704CE3|nr:ABC transporter ATP-binding protein/permease [Vaginimicrobium propionicum]
MLQLTDVRKSYTTGDFTQAALAGVTVNFRDSEFVAILGPSGSGKTTLLNIVGGLDKYDSGDIVIDGVSTKKYSNRDWDTYRNNRIGFVFQSYNLIPHQSVLANVELALTLAGVAPSERRARALAALADVGLCDHVHKHPNQLSGGQMQRVAIARALINDPEILLADEPTGALDSQTSTHIMELLKGIARHRLVIMVTHNPQLASEYATRTVHLKDGVITSDTDPFTVETDNLETRNPNKNRRMSFLTALGLSFTNLLAKKGRTLMTAFAGSIGIIGIAAILALATGVDDYIKNLEEETLSMYPLQIYSQGMDMTAMLGMANQASEPNSEPNKVQEMPMLGSVFKGMNSNDLTSLKSFIDHNGGNIDDYVQGIEYFYGITPHFYLQSDQIYQVNPDQTFNALGLTASAGTDFSAQLSDSNTFRPLVKDMSIVEGYYDIVAGDWPSSSDEMVVVLTNDGSVTDMALYALGVKDPDELAGMIDKLRAGENVERLAPVSSYSYDQIMSSTVKLVHPSDYYTLDDKYHVWRDRSSDKEYLKKLVADGRVMHISGIVKPKSATSPTPLYPAIYYTNDLTQELIDYAAKSEIVRDQLSHPGVNVFSGKSFAEESQAISEFDPSELVKIDKDKLAGAFSVNADAFTIDPSALRISMPYLDIDPNAMPQLDLSQVQGMNLKDIFVVNPPENNDGASQGAIAGAINDFLDTYSGFVESKGLDPSQARNNLQIFLKDPEGQAALAKMAQALQTGIQPVMDFIDAYFNYAEAESLDPLNVAATLQQFLEDLPGSQAIDKLDNAMPGSKTSIKFAISYLSFAQTSGLDPLDVQNVLPKFLVTDAGRQALGEAGVRLDLSGLENSLQVALTNYLSSVMNTYASKVGEQIAASLSSQISGSMENVIGQLAANMSNAMNIDEEKFLEAFSINADPQELAQIFMAMSKNEGYTLERNLRTLGYAELNEPTQIDIYPKDFESKGEIIKILDDYNDTQLAANEESKVITYTDVVGTLMSSVTDIVNVVSYVLIAFVSISLVVSSIMIGIITYVSVLERRKEIGILRAIGASKLDIARVFNAETLIIGFVAGLIGIVATLLLTIPANIVVSNKFGIDNIAQLPLLAAIILIVVSMALSFVAGLIPSSKASKEDPVEALRSE